MDAAKSAHISVQHIVSNLHCFRFIKHVPVVALSAERDEGVVGAC